MNAIKNITLSLSLILCINMPTYSNDIAEGKKLAFDRKKGNCLACHMIDDGELAGNSGPPLIAKDVNCMRDECSLSADWSSRRTRGDHIRTLESRLRSDEPQLRT